MSTSAGTPPSTDGGNEAVGTEAVADERAAAAAATAAIEEVVYDPAEFPLPKVLAEVGVGESVGFDVDGTLVRSYYYDLFHVGDTTDEIRHPSTTLGGRLVKRGPADWARALCDNGVEVVVITARLHEQAEATERVLRELLGHGASFCLETQPDWDRIHARKAECLRRNRCRAMVGNDVVHDGLPAYENGIPFILIGPSGPDPDEHARYRVYEGRDLERLLEEVRPLHEQGYDHYIRWADRTLGHHLDG